MTTGCDAEVQADADAAQADADTNTADVAALEAGPGTIIGVIRVLVDGTSFASWMANGKTPTVTYTPTGLYTITWPGVAFNINSQPAILTKINSGEISAGSVNGNLIVETYDSAGTAEDSQFWAFITNAT
jgi:hypothetical protein